jgi:tripartite-type tricarboxylate transporter receptor subunit TctC
MVHVQYRGSPPALTDLLGGQVHVYFASTTIAIEHIWTGKLRALAVTTAERLEALPDIPTLGEFLPCTAKERLALPPNPSYSLL